MKIRGNLIGTTQKPEEVLLSSTSLTEEQKNQARGNVGAAPTGYGIGGDSKTITDDVNNALVGGVYQCAYNIKNGPPNNFGNFTLFVQQHGPSEVIHTAKSVNGLFAERVGKRNKETGLWTFTEWEFVNPRMETDVEYRTIERINNKAVYKMRDSSGQILYRLDGETEWKTQHNLVGAAPTGYGIGSISKKITDDANNAIEGGIYYTDSGIKNIPSTIGNGTLFVQRYGNIYVCQTLKGLNGRIAERVGHKVSGVWTFTEWGHVNPPFYAGTDYRMIELINNKAVYKKINSYGQIFYRLDGETEWKPQHNLSRCAEIDGLDWNNAIYNGWYAGKYNTPDGGWWFGTVDRLNETKPIIVQRVHRQFVSTGDTAGFITAERRGIYVDENNPISINWAEWEYVNPPMNSGIEYRTTERWDGKPVYIKKINLGTLPAGSSGVTSVATDIWNADNPTLISYEVYATEGPFVYNVNELSGMHIYLWTNTHKWVINLEPKLDGHERFKGTAIIKWVYN